MREREEYSARTRSDQKSRRRIASFTLVAVASLMLWLGAATPGFADENMWFSATGPVAPGVKQSAAISPTGDTDWYYFYTSAPGEVKIGMNKTSGDATDVRLYRWDGGKLVDVGYTSTSHGTPLAVSAPAGLYYAKVDGYWDSSVGGYDLTISGTYATVTRPAAVQAHPLTVPVAEDYTTGWWNSLGPVQYTRPYVSAIDTVGDTDWYYFYTSAPGEVKIGMNKTSGDATEIRLYRWDGGKLVDVGYTSTSHDTPLAVSAPAGLYYAKVDGYWDSSVGGYDLTISGIHASPTRPAAVQAHPQAVLLAEDYTTAWWKARGLVQPTRPYVSAIDTVGDTDWYYFYTSGTGEVKVSMNKTSGDATEIRLYRWDGGKLVDVGYTSTSYDTPLAVSAPAGLYYAKVDGYWDSSVGGYDLTISGKRVTSSVAYVSGVSGNSSKLRRNHTYSFSGYVRPAGSVSLMVSKYSSKKRTYLAFKTIGAKVGSSTVPQKISGKWKPTSPGRYRLYWRTTGPGSLGVGKSGYRTVTVK